MTAPIVYVNAPDIPLLAVLNGERPQDGDRGIQPAREFYPRPCTLWERAAERKPSGAIRAEKYRRTGVVVLPRLEDERGPVICQARWDYRCRVERHVCPRHQSHGIIRAGVKVR